jgi:hypothetical protein
MASIFLADFGTICWYTLLEHIQPLGFLWNSWFPRTVERGASAMTFSKSPCQLTPSSSHPFRSLLSRRYVPRIELLESRELLSAYGGTTQLVNAYSRLPLSFEANEGQSDSQVRFLSRGSGYALFLTDTQVALNLQGTSVSSVAGAAEAPAADLVTMTLVGANAAPRIEGQGRLPGVSNYFLGNDPSQWRTQVPTYARVVYQDVYPGIDLLYYGQQRELEYDFVVAPGADPSAITLSFQGMQNLDLNAQGDLVLHTAGGDLVEHAPVIYQETADGRHQVAGAYVREAVDRIGFRIGSYDPHRALTIDPVLGYSTYFGGSATDEGYAIAVDAADNVYITGDTSSANFPTANAFQPAKSGGTNAFVSELSADGSTLIYSTYLGGKNEDHGYGIAVDAAGNAYITGKTNSTDFPTVNPIQSGLKGMHDAFVAKLASGGSALLYSTYLGGSQDDVGNGIAVDAVGDAYVIGSTSSNNFPTANAIQPHYAGGSEDAFVAELAVDGTALIYSTYLGGSQDDTGTGIAVDAAGDAYLIGGTYSSNFPTANALQENQGGSRDAFVAELSAGGTALIYSTYLGGTSADTGTGIAVDNAGDAYITGYTTSLDFPTINALQPSYGGGLSDAFVAELSAGGTSLVYSTYLGGTGADDSYSIAVDAAGNAFVTGYTFSIDFPLVDPIQASFGGGYSDAFVAEISVTGTALVYSTYLGGNDWDWGNGIAADAAGSAFVIGVTYSTDFPTANAFQDHQGGHGDAFVTRIDQSSMATTKGVSSLAPAPLAQTFRPANALPESVLDGDPQATDFWYSVSALPDNQQLRGVWTGSGDTLLTEPTTPGKLSAHGLDYTRSSVNRLDLLDTDDWTDTEKTSNGLSLP